MYAVLVVTSHKSQQDTLTAATASTRTLENMTFLSVEDEKFSWDSESLASLSGRGYDAIAVCGFPSAHANKISQVVLLACLLCVFVSKRRSLVFVRASSGFNPLDEYGTEIALPCHR